MDNTFAKLSADRAFLNTVFVRLRQMLGQLATTLAMRGLFCEDMVESIIDINAEECSDNACKSV